MNGAKYEKIQLCTMLCSIAYHCPNVEFHDFGHSISSCRKHKFERRLSKRANVVENGNTLVNAKGEGVIIPPSAFGIQ